MEAELGVVGSVLEKELLNGESSGGAHEAKQGLETSNTRIARRCSNTDPLDSPCGGHLPARSCPNVARVGT